VFGHHFGGQGATFRLPTSSGPNETLTSPDATQRSFLYHVARADCPNLYDHPGGRWSEEGWLSNDDQRGGGWVWQDFFRAKDLSPEDRYAEQRKWPSRWRVIEESNRHAIEHLKEMDKY
jgi:hypothetical protein